jgi:hypothetical protein
MRVAECFTEPLDFDVFTRFVKRLCG